MKKIQNNVDNIGSNCQESEEEIIYNERLSDSQDDVLHLWKYVVQLELNDTEKEGVKVDSFYVNFLFYIVLSPTIFLSLKHDLKILNFT